MEECVIIVDNSNIWIEGMKCSARIKGMKSSVEGKEPCDYNWRIDFGKLLDVVSEGKRIKKAILVGSRPPKNDSLWTAAANKGYEVRVEDRNYRNQEKAVDTTLVADGVKMLYTTDPAVLKILSGDCDFKPLLDHANQANWESEIWSFSTALGSRNSDFISLADKVIELDGIIEKIQLNR